jgi:hypothetical protein
MSTITYPDWMDITVSGRTRFDRWADASYPAHGFTGYVPGARCCIYCGNGPGHIGHRIGAQAAVYGPHPTVLSVRAAVLAGRGPDHAVPWAELHGDELRGQLTRGDISLEEYSALRDGKVPARGTYTRVDSGTVTIAGETYSRVPF